LGKKRKAVEQRKQERTRHRADWRPAADDDDRDPTQPRPLVTSSRFGP
jgi:hypothetical protein